MAVTIEVRENGSVNHLWYLHIWVDNIRVYQKSFKSKTKTEAAKDTAIQEVLAKYVRLVRTTANFIVDSEIQKYNTKPTVFRGTGHFDD